MTLEDADSGGSSQEEVKAESLGKIKQRHGHEKKELKQRCAALLKNAGKDKKLAKTQIKDMEAELAARHAKEMEDYENRTLAETVSDDVPAPSAAKGPSKKQRQLERKLLAEAERRKQLDEELRDDVDYRQLESEKLERKLSPLSLTISEIRPDGHCLYHAIAHQLKLNGVMVPEPEFGHLRHQAADYIRTHSNDFLPFLLTDEGETMSPVQFAKHCDAIANVNEGLWGGQPEITALASIYNCRIVVYSADADPIIMSGPNTSEDSMTLRLSFHKYILMGNHYNSLIGV